MRLIARYESSAEALERGAFLRSRGIATYVTDLTSVRYNLPHKGHYRAGLWAILESQYEDAEALLEDPGHRVEHPLSEDEMAALETEGGTNARRLLIKWLLITVIGLGALAALVVALSPP